MVIAAERTRDPKQPKRFEKNKNIDSRGVSQLQDSAQMANRCHGPLPILSWRRNNQPAFIRSKEDETNCHNWSNTFLFDQASPRDARRYAALVVGSWSGFVVVSPWPTIVISLSPSGRPELARAYAPTPLAFPLAGDRRNYPSDTTRAFHPVPACRCCSL